MNKISIDWLSEDECKKLIGIHTQYWSEFGKPHRDTEPLQIENLAYSLGVYASDRHFLLRIHSKLTCLARENYKNIHINYCEIVRWPVGAYQTAHFDRPEHVFTSIAYLNSDFDGGNTFIGEELVEPKTGSMVMFSGANTIHGVTEVLKAPRYTLAAWYSDYDTFVSDGR